MAGKRSALIVATSEYKDSRLPPLPATEDAAALKAVLSNPAIGGYDVRVALNSRVETLRRTLDTFFAERARDDVLLLHFSGHGLKDDDGQLFLTVGTLGRPPALDRDRRRLAEPTDQQMPSGNHRSVPRLLLRGSVHDGAHSQGCWRHGWREGGFPGARAGRHRGIRCDAVRLRGRPPDRRTAGAFAIHEGPSGRTRNRSGRPRRRRSGFDQRTLRVPRGSGPRCQSVTNPHQVRIQSGGGLDNRYERPRPAKASLPTVVQTQLASENSIDRFNALFDLQAISNGLDPALVAVALRGAPAARAR